MIFIILFFVLINNVFAENSSEKDKYILPLEQTQTFALDGIRFTGKNYLGAIGTNDGGLCYQSGFKNFFFAVDEKFNADSQKSPYKFILGAFYEPKETGKAHKRITLIYIQQQKHFATDYSDWKRSIILTNRFKIATVDFGNSIGVHTYDTKLANGVDFSLGFALDKELLKFKKFTYGTGIEYRFYLGPRLLGKSPVGEPASSSNSEYLEQNNEKVFFNQFLQKNRFKLSFKYCDLIYEMNFTWKDFENSANEIVGFDYNQSNLTLAIKKWWK